MTIDFNEYAKMDADTISLIARLKDEQRGLDETDREFNRLENRINNMAEPFDYLAALSAENDEGEDLRFLLLAKVKFGEEQDIIITKFRAKLAQYGRDCRDRGEDALSTAAYNKHFSRFCNDPAAKAGNYLTQDGEAIVGHDVIDRGLKSQHKVEFYRCSVTGDRCGLRLQMVASKEDEAAAIAHISDRYIGFFSKIMYCWERVENSMVQSKKDKTSWAELSASICGFLNLSIPDSSKRGFTVVKGKAKKSLGTLGDVVQSKLDQKAKRSASAVKAAATRAKNKALAAAVQQFPATGGESSVASVVVEKVRGEEWGQRISEEGEATLKRQGIGQRKNMDFTRA